MLPLTRSFTLWGKGGAQLTAVLAQTSSACTPVLTSLLECLSQSACDSKLPSSNHHYATAATPKTGNARSTASSPWNSRLAPAAKAQTGRSTAAPAATDVPAASQRATEPASEMPSTSGFFSGPRKVVSLSRAGPTSGTAARKGGLEGIVHVRNTFNNIIMTLTDINGNAIATSSAGIVGFRNARKSLPIAAERTAEDLARKSLQRGYGIVSVRLNGMGSNKQYAVQALHGAGLDITQLLEVTPVPYNGCRPPKKRRI